MAATRTADPQVQAPTAERLALAARSLGLILGVGVLLAIALLSLRFGSLSISTSDAWDALFSYDSAAYNQVIVREMRLPRTLIAIAVGGGLAVAGAMMQAVTRNPLAGPSILGVSSGASFAIVTAVFYFGLSSSIEYVWFAFAGALAASALVFLIGSVGRDGVSPVKLALAGVVVSSLLSAWSSALLLLDEETLNTVRFWAAGSVAGRELSILAVVSPFLILGTLVSLFLGHQLNVLNMGDDYARSLGMRTGRTRILCSLLVVLITGAAVSVAGPIGFLGLATPHIVRAIVGPDYRWVLPYSLIFGAILLLGADIVGRLIAKPAEIQVGIMTALLGAPFLIYLARKTRMSD